jgi:hypothetical protein
MIPLLEYNNPNINYQLKLTYNSNSSSNTDGINVAE